MLKILLVLFITVPLFEIYILVEIGQFIGTPATILLIITTALLGAYLLYMQGNYTVARILQSIKERASPAAELVSGLLLFAASILLLTPGFFTDLVGFLCLLPGLRIYIANILVTYYFSSWAPDRKGQGAVIEGEYTEERSAPQER